MRLLVNSAYNCRLRFCARAHGPRARDKAWADLQASLSMPPANAPPESKKMVKIRKTHRFAGEDVRHSDMPLSLRQPNSFVRSEVVEVAEDSEDAKKWPLWTPSTGPSTFKSPQSSISLGAMEVRTGPSSTTSAPVPGPPLQKPGRRKSRIQLSEIPSAGSQKAKKLTTVEKSAIDWKAHAQDNAQLKDELDANRRGGGYLEKVQFLNDVGDRRDKLLEERKERKRRRG